MSGTISVIDASSNKRIAVIDIDDTSVGSRLMPHNIQSSPDGRTVWVTVVPEDGELMNEVAIIDPRNNKLIKDLPIGKDQHLAHIVFDNKSQFAFITATESGLVTQVDASTSEVSYYYVLGEHFKPHGIRYANGYLYVASMGTDSMAIINTSTKKISYVDLGGPSIQTAVTPDGRFVFASLYDSREVVRYDQISNQLSRIALPAAQGPIQLYPTPDSRLLFICDQGIMDGRPSSNKVFVMDITLASVIKTIIAGNGPHGVVVSKDGKTAYVTNSSDNTISVIDIAAQKVTATIPVGEGPNGITYWTESAGQP